MKVLDSLVVLFGPDAVPDLILMIARASMVIVVAWSVTVILRKASAATRHMVWTTSFLCLLLLPAAGRLVPAWEILPGWLSSGSTPQALSIEPILDLGTAPSEPSAGPTVARVTPTVVHEADPSPPRWEIVRSSDSTSQLPRISRLEFRLMMVWAVVSVAIVFFLIAGLLRVGFVGRRARPARQEAWLKLRDEVAHHLELQRIPLLLVSDDAPVPVTWGLLRPRLLLPSQAETWTELRLRNVLLHEMAHLKRGDLVALLTSELVCALYWFNPLVWLAANRMRMEREHACDDLVLAGGASPAAYARDLLDVVTSLRSPTLPVGAIGMARPSELGERLRAVLDPKRPRGGVSLRRRGLATLIGLGSLLVTAAAAPAGRDLDVQLPLDEVVEHPTEPPPSTRTRSDLRPPPPESTEDVAPLVSGSAVDEDKAPIRVESPLHGLEGRAMSLLPLRLLDPPDSAIHLTANTPPPAPPSTRGRNAPATSMSQTVRGTVVDNATGLPLGAVQLSLVARDNRLVSQYVTNEAGRFRVHLPDEEPYRLRAFRTGYAPATSDALLLYAGQAATAELRLQPEPEFGRSSEAEDRPLVLLREGFYRRAQLGFGHFLSPSDLERMPGIMSLSDLFRNVPGVAVMREDPDSWDLFGTRSEPCRLSVAIDGVMVQVGGPGRQGTYWTEFVSYLRVAAIEVYSGAAGVPEWIPDSVGPCGAAIIWTKGHVGLTTHAAGG